MKKGVLNCLIVLMSIFTIACENQGDASDIIIYAIPDKVGVVESASNIHIEYSIATNSEYIKDLTISTIHPEEGEIINYTKEVYSPALKDSYDYKVPYVLKENSEIKIYIKATDNLGNESKFALKFRVIGAKLEELSSIELLNPLSSNNDGINTATSNTIRKATLSIADEPTSFWIRQFTEEEKLQNPQYLPLEWNTSITESKVKFAVNNSYNYSEATSTTLKSAYYAASKNNYISNIKNGDIILVGVNDEAWGVIKVSYIIDDAGIDNDKMILNLKTIK